jgi:undecaprenyl phosphate N,N'-diacetylbacillosamine 1-phosphate transferase
LDLGAKVELLIFIFIFIEQLLTKDFGPFIISEPRISKDKVFKLYKLNMYKEYKRQKYIKNSPEYKNFKTWAYLQKDPSSIRYFGNIMKNTYMDELGQFINILKGDMSFVGPRPLPLGYDLNNEPPRRILKAGLVGFAANRVKNEGDTISKQKTDKEYLELYQNSSSFEILKVDLIVMLDGFRAVLKAKGY